MLHKKMSPVMSNIQKDLSNDTDGKILKKNLDCLAEYAAKIQREMDKGVPPSEYDQLTLLKNAIDESEIVLKKMWDRLHF